MKRIYCIFLWLVFSYSLSLGNIRHQKFYHLTRNEGLSQSTVNCIIKDAQGYMWFGTRDGLNKYDAYKFTHYKYQAADPNSIGLGRVNVLFVDSKNRLWAGTDQGGLNLYNLKTYNFTQYHSSGSSETDDLIDIRAILESEQGMLWIAARSGLWLFNPETEVFTPVGRQPVYDPERMVLTREGNLFVGTSTGVYTIEKTDSKEPQEMVSIPVEGLEDMEVFSLFVDHRRNNLWVGTYGRGAYCYDLVTGSVTEFSTQQQAPYHLEHNIVRAFAYDPDGNIMIGSGGGGLHCYFPERQEMSLMQHKLQNQNSLNSDIIYSLFQDDNLNLWVGTYNGGVNILLRHKDKFEHIMSYGGANELSNNSVLSILEDRNHHLWIGTDGGGLNYYDPETGNFRHYLYDRGQSNSPGGNVIKSMCMDQEGRIWMGTFNRGLTCYDSEKDRFTRYLSDDNSPGGLTSNHIWDIAIDREGKVWLATLGGGLNCYDPVRNEFNAYMNDPQNPNSLSDNTLSCLAIDSKGAIWVGSEYGGICRLLDEERGVFKIYNRSGSEASINSNNISCIFEDSRGNLWVGTIGGGLNFYDPVADRFYNYMESDGLASDLIYSILEDEEENLWISTNNGLSQFMAAVYLPENPVFHNYNVGDGLQSNEFNTLSACKTHDGTLYFGGVNGMNCFKSSEIKRNNHIPPVVITDFKIFNKSVGIGEPGSPLSVPISQTSSINLKHSQSVFSFEFAALDFTNPSHNKYRFMLEGFEKKWNEVGTQRMATYTNLNPGTYVFRVQGSNNDGLWNDEGYSVQITILAPVWKRWWFRLIAGMVLLVIVAGVLWWRIKDNEIQRLKLKKQVGERTMELQDLNTILEEQNKEIYFQQQELMQQKENLEAKNLELAGNHTKIQEQNRELEEHRNNLQKLVHQRTAELEKAKIKAEESDRLKSAFLANMSHEIRTPLNAIVGFSTLLAEDNEIEADDRLQYLSQIRNNTNVLLVLIADILDLSRIESNQLDIEYTEINLNEFFDEVVAAVKVKSRKVKFIATNQLAAGNYVFVSDRIRLRQVFSNLLDNALKFTGAGLVEFGLKKSQSSLLFWVKDTGIGMSAEVLTRIFERFYKYESMNSQVYRGSGLGLTITQNLVKLLGGEIRVESEERKGSKFEVILPIEPVRKGENGNSSSGQL
ncbi:MAG: hypothetical protein JW801_11215 [Bacteroidales bacterium]|nr:hypothetical protein [Bacteroidales bacterium]